MPFCVLVENSLRRQLALAGLDVGRGLVVLDNMNDAETGRQNADLMLARKPHLFIEFQVDPLVSNIVAARCAATGIPVVAVDVPVPGVPFIGVDSVFLRKVPRIADMAMAASLRDEPAAGAAGSRKTWILTPTPSTCDTAVFSPEPSRREGRRGACARG